MSNKTNPGVNNQTDGDMQPLVDRVKNHRNTIIVCSILVVLIVFGCLLMFSISNSNSAKADVAAGRADMEMNDSVALELYKEAAEMGHKSGNRAAAMAAIKLYEQGNYEEAISYLKEADLKGKVGAPGVYSLMGDCYANLEQYADALKAYDKAIGKADGNPAIVPLILVKKANIYRAQQQYADEYEALKTVVDKYPGFVVAHSDVQRLYERAKASAGK